MKDESDKRFFITHSHTDNIFAERFAGDLRRLGFDGFFDIYSISPGDNIPANINKGLAECDVYVPILSKVALDPLVRTVDDKNSRQVWKGETRHGQVAVIDMLTVKIDASKHSKELSGIGFMRSVPPNTIALDYFVSGITIEIGTLK